jgi:hypothetical protein
MQHILYAGRLVYKIMQFFTLQCTKSVLGLRGRYRDSLLAGMSGDRISVGKRLSTSWGLSILLHKEYRVIFGGKAARAWP